MNPLRKEGGGLRRLKFSVKLSKPVIALVAAGATAATGLVVVDQMSTPSVNAKAAALDTACTPVKLVVVPGTWETTPGADPNNPAGPQMLRAITDRLQGQFGGKVSSYWVPYSATAFDQGLTYADSKQTGLNNARSAMSEIAKQCPGTRFVGLGYSQGADVAGDVAAGIGNGRGPVPASDLLATGLVADPGKGTRGEVNLGRQVPDSHGMAGARKPGYGAVSGRVANVCLPGDLYCAIPNKYHLLTALGAVLGHAGVANLQGSAEDELNRPPNLAKQKRADISALPPAIQRLVQQARAHDTKGAAKTADDLGKMIAPLQSIVRLLGNPLIVNALLATPDGSPTKLAGQALAILSKVDMVALANDLQTALNAASKQDVNTLIRVALDAAQRLAPLAGLPSDQVSKAAWVISGLMPEALLAQANNIIGGITRIDYKGIQKAANSVPALVQRGDVAGLYKALVAIEDRLMPLADTATKVDLKPLAALLAMWPPGTPERAVGEALVILNRVDWSRITRDLRALQGKLEKFDPKRAPRLDPANPRKSLQDIFGVNVLSMIPAVTDLAQHGLDVAGLKLPNGTLAELLSSDLNPVEIIKEGLAAAVFYGSNVHTAYGSASVEGPGRPAVDTLADWLAQRIAAA